MIPVLDVLAGQVVRAQRGERSAYRPIISALAAGSEPCALARALLAAAGTPARGPALLYVADLDALQGRAVQRALLADLLAALPDTMLWLDAGFADRASAQALQAALGPRVQPVFASEALASADALDGLAEDEHAILSLDSRGAQPLDPAGCWQRPSAWPRRVIVMTLDRVGAGLGPDLTTLNRLRDSAPGREWIGAGGVRTAADLAAAARAGASAWLVASALHDGTLKPAPAHGH